MIESIRGNLLEADAEAIVNTVNCVGAMGKGLALQFHQAYPANSKAYKAACESKELRPGRMLIVPLETETNPHYIVNFPTKDHWKYKSKREYIEQGLQTLAVEIQRLGIQSIAIPPLGCGLGGLDWSEIKPLIVQAFASLPDVRVLIYEPLEAG